MSEQARWGTGTRRAWRDFSIILGPVLFAAAALSPARARAEEPAAIAPTPAPVATAPTASVEASSAEVVETEGATAGSLSRMAEGYEQRGKLARAWKLYVQAAEQALLAGDTEGRARAIGKAETLAGELARLTLQVSFFDRKPGTVWLDDEPLGPGDFGLPMPLDPGSHRLIARRPGYVRWHKTFEVSAGKSYSLTVPTLALERSAPSPLRAVPTQGPAAPTASPPPVAPSVSPPSRKVTTVLRLQKELARLQEAREDVSLTFPVLMMAAGTGLGLAGGIDLVSRATGGSGVLGGGAPTQDAWLGVGALAGGGALAVVGAVVLNFRVEKRRILDLLIDRRLERLSRFGVSAGLGPGSGTLTLHGTF